MRGADDEARDDEARPDGSRDVAGVQGDRAAAVHTDVPVTDAPSRNGTNGDGRHDRDDGRVDADHAPEADDDDAGHTADAADAADDHDDHDDAARRFDTELEREAALVGSSTTGSADSSGGTGRPPVLPHVEARPAPPMYRAVAAPVTGAATWYRTDQDRYKSVHRRANPWFRRLARGVIGLSFLAAIAVGLFFGARLVQDYLDRDRLPAIGVDVPEIRATSFEVRSTSPAPAVDGTITLDTTSGAFEFLGRGTGPQAGTQLVSPDGSTVFVRVGSGPWEVDDGGSPVIVDVRRAVSYLRDDDSADAILTSQLRRGYVDLVERVEIGEGDDEIRRYQLRLDTDSFDADFPLQYREFQDRALPGVTAVRAMPLTIAVDDDGVLVEVDDETSNWSWQRLTYSDQPFVPLDPADDLLTGTIEITDGNVDDG